jgi:uncharacterized protein YuzE
MRMDYDLDADALYITLLDEPIAKTRAIEDLTMVDVTADGRLVGIEVIAPGRAWALDAILEAYAPDAVDAAQLRAQFASGEQVRRETPRLCVA